MNTIITEYIALNALSLIDLTHEIKTCEEYNTWNKSLKDDKSIFTINLEKVNNDVAWHILFILELNELDIKSTVYYNKSNKTVIKSGEVLYLKTLTSLLNKTDDGCDIEFECNICFNDLKNKTCLSCPRCDFMYCKTCAIKIKRKERIFKCVSCKYSMLCYKNLNQKL